MSVQYEYSMKTLHFLLTISLGIVIILVIGNIANVQACTPYENCVKTLPHSATQTASFNGNHATYGIQYNLSNATLVASLLDIPARELIFKFNATDVGQLMVELPRGIIDSTRYGNDKPYLVFVGDVHSGTKRVQANEIQNTSSNRILIINFTKNDDEIGIVGTFFIENNSTAKIHNGYGAWSPLQQYGKGFDAQDIVCKNGFVLIIKAEYNSPACVKPQTKAKLVERGWALSSLNDLSTDKGVFQSVIKMPVDDVGLQCEKEFKPRSFEHTVFSNGTSLTINYVPVFLMKPNSTGKICITTWSDDKSSKYEMKTSAGISKDHYSETSDATVVPYPENIVIDNTNKTIIYAITTTGNASGFYRIGTNWDSCGGGLPLAVGYDSSYSFDNDFPWLWETYPCPFGSGIPSHMQITGLTGIDVAYITKVYD